MSKDVIEFYEKELEKHEYTVKRFERMVLQTKNELKETKKEKDRDILLNELKDYERVIIRNESIIRRLNTVLLNLKNV